MAAGHPTILRNILARKREEVIERRARSSLGHLEQRIDEQSSPRGFAAALAQRITGGEPAVIAEVKKASPASASCAASIKGTASDRLPFS